MNEYRYQELDIGHKETFRVTITREMEDAFRQITGDSNPLHRDDAFALEAGQGKFSSHVTFGMLTSSFYSTLAGVYLPGKYSLIHSLDIKLQKPVYCGDELTVTGEIADKQDELGLLILKAEIRNQKQKCVSKATMKVLCLR